MGPKTDVQVVFTTGVQIERFFFFSDRVTERSSAVSCVVTQDPLLHNLPAEMSPIITCLLISGYQEQSGLVGPYPPPPSCVSRPFIITDFVVVVTVYEFSF